MTKMLNVELPKLIYVNSSERVNTERHFPILNREKSLNPGLFDYYNQLDITLDTLKWSDGYLVNKEVALGTVIDVDLYIKTLKGEFEGTFQNRQMFVERVDDVCFVRKLKLCSKHPAFYCGSCFDFYNHLTCHHAAIFQYRDALPQCAHKLPQRRNAVSRRNKKGMDRLQRAKHKRLIRNESLRKENRAEQIIEASLMDVFRQPNNSITSDVTGGGVACRNDNNDVEIQEIPVVTPVSYTHLTLPTNREV